jgi:uncharacterized damage-inducible protein DinB
MMTELDAIRNEYNRYRTLAEKAFGPLNEHAVNQLLAEETNSVAMLVRHISGNLQSRFTNFLTEDGEKPERDRDAEFAERAYTKEELEQLWAKGWEVLDGALATLTVDDLGRTVQIRGVSLSVNEALARSVTHLSYHVGQIVLIARILTKPGQWESLSIPRGESAAWNTAPGK